MNKQYSIIYCDPPWQFNSVKTGGNMNSGAAAKYDVMSLDQLKALDVPALCAPDCVLVMWYVSSQPQEALDLVKAWGFTVKNMNGFIWRKLSTNLLPHFGMGYWTRAGAECALIAVRGKPKSACKSIRQVRDEPVGRHSEKPAIFRDDIVKLCGDVPRLEMFARIAPAGWDVFGNEVESSVHIDGGELDDAEQSEPSSNPCQLPGPAEPSGNSGELPDNDLQPEIPAIDHKWPQEVIGIVEQALDKCPCEPTDQYYDQLCQRVNSELLSLDLAGASDAASIVTESLIETLKKDLAELERGAA